MDDNITNEMTPENYRTIQGLVVGIARHTAKEEGIEYKTAYAMAHKNIANMLGVSEDELRSFMVNGRNEFARTKRGELRILVKSQLLYTEETDQVAVENILKRELQDVPVGMGKRLVFADAEMAKRAIRLLYKVSREIGWGGEHMEKNTRYYKSRINNKTIEVWRLA